MTKQQQYYQERIKNGLCSCGERLAQGKTLCIRCLQINAAKQKLRYDSYTDEQKKQHREYARTWMKNHPDKNNEYQRRYRENGKNGFC